MLLFVGDASAQHLVNVGAGLSVALGRELRPGVELGVGWRWLCGPYADTDSLAFMGTLGAAIRGRWVPGDGVGFTAAVRGGVWADTLRFWYSEPGAFAVADVEGGLDWDSARGAGLLVGGDAEAGTAAWMEQLGYYDPLVAKVGPVGVALHADTVIGRGDADGRVAIGPTLAVMRTLNTIGYMGRPLRVAGRVVEPPVACRRAPDEVAARWMRSGRAELASVATFLRLARELGELGAPGALRARAMRAATDELGHAALCFDLAARRCGPVATAMLPVVPRRFSNRATALATMVAEALVDGVGGEGVAAREMEERASAARDDRDVRVLARIAAEEATHAALGRDLAAWGLASGGGTGHAVDELAPFAVLFPAGGVPASTGQWKSEGRREAGPPSSGPKPSCQQQQPLQRGPRGLVEVRGASRPPGIRQEVIEPRRV